MPLAAAGKNPRRWRRDHYSYDALGRLVNVDDGHWPLAYNTTCKTASSRNTKAGAPCATSTTASASSATAASRWQQLDYRHLSGGRLSSIDLNGSRLTAHQFSAGANNSASKACCSANTSTTNRAACKPTQSASETRTCSNVANYDANGNLAGIDDSRKGNRSYHYDPLDRLISVRGAHRKASPTTRRATC
jgi:YD repeat-containing protein